MNAALQKMNADPQKLNAALKKMNAFAAINTMNSERFHNKIKM